MEKKINSTAFDSSKDGQTIPPLFDVSGIRQKHLDIRYSSVSPSQKLDIFLPESGSGQYPTLVHIHGGAFMLGDKRDIQIVPWLEALKHGYALASINYRLSGEAIFPAAVCDAKNAIRFLRRNSAKYQLDGERFAVVGGSAGGNISAMVSVTGDKSVFVEEQASGSESCAVKACVEWFGPTDFLKMDEQLAAAGLGPCDHSEKDSPESRYMGGQITTLESEWIQLANPMTYIHPGMPHMFIEHGSRDHIVPCMQSVMFVEKIRKELGYGCVQFEILQGADHADPMFNSEENMQKVFNYLDKHLKE